MCLNIQTIRKIKCIYFVMYIIYDIQVNKDSVHIKKHVHFHKVPIMRHTYDDEIVISVYPDNLRGVIKALIRVEIVVIFEE